MLPSLGLQAFCEEDVGQVSLAFAVLWVERKRTLVVLLRLIQIPQIFPSHAKKKLGLRQGRIAAKREFIFANGVVDATRFVQSFAVIELSLGIPRQDLGDFRRPLDWRHDTARQLRCTKYSKRDYECRPTQAVPQPGWPKPRRRQGCCTGTFD